MKCFHYPIVCPAAAYGFGVLSFMSVQLIRSCTNIASVHVMPSTGLNKRPRPLIRPVYHLDHNLSNPNTTRTTTKSRITQYGKPTSSGGTSEIGPTLAHIPLFPLIVSDLSIRSDRNNFILVFSVMSLQKTKAV
jgi:hypothetical protein